MISYLKYWGSRTYRNISLEIYPLGLAGKALGVSNVSMMGNTSYRERTEFSLYKVCSIAKCWYTFSHVFCQDSRYREYVDHWLAYQQIPNGLDHLFVC